MNAQMVAGLMAAAATGDNANIILYVVLFVAAVAVVAVLAFKDKIFKSKGQKNNKNSDAKKD